MESLQLSSSPVTGHGSRGTHHAQCIGLCALLAVSLAAHSRFVFRGCGEQDEARLVTDAIVWRLTGQLSPGLSEYRVWTSPLYLHGIKKLLDWGVPRLALPDVLNWVNAVVGTLTLVPMYLLLKRLADARAALATCVLFSFAPAFWLANLYGMPHLPSFGFLLTALLLYARALDGSAGSVPRSACPTVPSPGDSGEARLGKPAVAPLAAAAGCMAAACALKLDMVLCGGAFLGVAVCQRKVTVRNVAAAVGIVAVGVALSLLYSGSLAAPEASADQLAAGATREFPLRAAALASAGNLLPIVMAFGPVLFGAALAALAWCGLAGTTHRRLALLALLWGLPPLLHWGLKFGNSARHVLAPSLPLVMLAGVALVSLARSPGRAWAILALLVLANYASTQRGSGTVVPSSRIFESAGNTQKRIAELHRQAREFTANPAAKKLLVGYWSNPYVLYQVVAEARNIELTAAATARRGEMRIVAADGRAQQIAWIYVATDSDVDAALARQPEGWLLWTMDPDVAKALERRRESQSPIPDPQRPMTK